MTRDEMERLFAFLAEAHARRSLEFDKLKEAQERTSREIDKLKEARELTSREIDKLNEAQRTALNIDKSSDKRREAFAEARYVR